MAKEYNLLLIGDPNVGNTSILQRFMEGYFTDTRPTIGM